MCSVVCRLDQHSALGIVIKSQWQANEAMRFGMSWSCFKTLKIEEMLLFEMEYFKKLIWFINGFFCLKNYKIEMSCLENYKMGIDLILKSFLF